MAGQASLFERESKSHLLGSLLGQLLRHSTTSRGCSLRVLWGRQAELSVDQPAGMCPQSGDGG